MKKILIILVYSIIITLLVLFILVQLNPIYIKHILIFFRDQRGTLLYEGETEGRENMTIFFGIIIPLIFSISLGLVISCLFIIRKLKK